MSELTDTLPGRLAHFAALRPTAVALRKKHLGVWREYTWAEYRDRVAAMARALLELGVNTGDAIAIVSDNRPEWLIADLAAQGLGARSVGVYQTNPPADVAYVVNDSGSVVVFCEDQEQVDKLVAIRESTPAVRTLVVFDPRGTHGLDDRIIGFDELLDRGRALLAEDTPRASGGGDAATWFAERVRRLDPDAPSMVVYTSGTTGPPKGAMLSSANVLPASVAFTADVELSERDTILSYLPLCHVAEKIFSVFTPLTVGCVVHFGESIATIQNDLREVSPTVFLGVPRIWEKMHASITIGIKDSSWLKRRLFAFFAARGAAISDRRRAGRRRLLDSLTWLLGDLLVFRPLQERLGLRRCWLPVSGAAPIGSELLRTFHGLGVPILEGYGMTESGGVSHVNPPEAVRLGTVGRVMPTIECRIADDGEILLRGPSVFCGYLNRPEATAEAVDAAGWLHTGDIGSVDADGYLTITGRKKEIIITSGGKNLSPEKIENALKTSPYIKEAIAVGDQRRFISALVQIEYDSVGDWATRRKLPYTSYADLAAKDEVVALVRDEIDRANAQLARVESVRAFRILPKELHQDDGELTATQKVRRRAVLTTFAPLIDQLYRGGAQ